MNYKNTVFFCVLIILLSACGGGAGETDKSASQNHQPVANAGVNKEVNIGENITLNGSGTDQDGDTLTYRWDVLSAPEDSLYSFSNDRAATTEFSANKIGEYQIKLTVNDGKVESAPSIINITYRESHRLNGFVHHLGLVYGIEYKLDEQGTSLNRTEAGGATYCNTGTTVSFYIGVNKFGEINCQEDMHLMDMTLNGETLPDHYKTNVSWMLQILDWDQLYSNGKLGSFDIALDIEIDAEIDFYVPTDDFIETNNITDIVRSNLDKYHHDIRNSFIGWQELSDEQLVDAIIGDVNKAKAYAQSYEVYGKAEFERNSNLEMGFPYEDKDRITNATCQYLGGPHNSVLLTNLQGDEKLEIIVNIYPCGGLVMLNHEGTELISYNQGEGVMGFSAIDDPHNPSYKLIASAVGIKDSFLNNTVLFERPGNSIYPPTTAKFGDMQQESIFLPTPPSNILRYSNEGVLEEDLYCDFLEFDQCNDFFRPPIVGQLDNSPGTELLFASKQAAEGIFLTDLQGNVKEGFPIIDSSPIAYTLVVGDVDGDGENEIISMENMPGTQIFKIYNMEGVKEATIPQEKLVMGHNAHVVLADLTNDDIPEIIVAGDSYLFVYTYKQNRYQILDGWPQRYNFLGGFSHLGIYPVVGDIDGDGAQDIVIYFKNHGPSVTIGDDATQYGFRPIEGRGRLLAFSNHGKLLSGFPKIIDDFASVHGIPITPAIGDIDLDGRNEIVLSGSSETKAPVVFVYDLGGDNHGDVQWGQFGKDEKRSNTFQ
ncbi:FG-GAP-like repeat-containing protein [Alteromonas oceani]|uniref:FG-GAP-like repeat-containing protein n=1 Tax=Alteromonas oceani TaxID=2071609 RepID=A0ABV7JR42_9ALTE|nr:VCBS repeat-containing protein [Alteromonas oceani]